MIISTKDWLNYINKLRRLSDTAAEKMQQYIQRHGFSDTEAIIDFAYALVTKYGEGSAELAAQMYDEIAQLSGVLVPPAEPAATATMEETARAIQGSLIQSPTGQKLTQVADRLVKQAAADTTLQNAKRDGAEWAWVPMGDTCGFCITLASRGWQRASQAQMRGNHASHIHAHCDCQFSIRFNGKGGVKGYDPDVYKKMYDEAEGSSSAEKVKSLRRSLEDRDKINAQKRAAYAKSHPKKTLTKSLTVDDFVKIKDGTIKEDVIDYIYNYLDNNNYIKVFDSVVIKELEDVKIFDTEYKQNGTWYNSELQINTQFFAGKSLERINKDIYNASGTRCQNLEDAIIHEVYHGKMAMKANIAQIDSLNEEKGIEGISNTATKDKLESISEIGVLYERGEYAIVPEEGKKLFETYFEVKYD